MHKQRFQFGFRLLTAFVALSFLLNSLLPGISFAQMGLELPRPGRSVSLSPAFVPPHLTGLTIHPDNPLQFDFIIDTGDEPLKGQALKDESMKLVKYFMAS